MAKHKLSLEDEFQFGKHRDETLEDVLETDPTYVRWAIEENIIELDDEAFEVYEDKISEVE